MVIIDACPVCQPGIPAAAPALADPEPVNGGTITPHQCPACGTAWETFWDRWGWPVDRLWAPVSPEQAARNADGLAGALKGRSDERSAAA